LGSLFENLKGSGADQSNTFGPASASLQCRGYNSYYKKYLFHLELVIRGNVTLHNYHQVYIKDTTNNEVFVSFILIIIELQKLYYKLKTTFL